ncbi:type IV secretion system DNA-binding domain-containing protein [uncultured Erythrobacter sp.]|uniref:type IV secretion system DNA-binding domain-containing protein n=1 Tax=uncultured Erythrobacter sp. TaxID=263913 RepID=UPI002603657F|nr:type IV secretion system DNA-binding domain-containing protein [uncultured Erythrobacter sp.]
MKHNLVNFTRGSQLLGHFGFMFAAGLKGPLIITVLVILGLIYWEVTSSLTDHQTYLVWMHVYSSFYAFMEFDPYKLVNLTLADGSLVAFPIGVVTDYPPMKQAITAFEAAVKAAFVTSAWVLVPGFIAFWWVAEHFGWRSKQRKHVRGASLVSLAELESEIDNHNRIERAREYRQNLGWKWRLAGSSALASAGLYTPAHLAGVSWPWRKEQSHTMLVGTTGTGKTVALFELLSEIRKRGERAVIFDLTGALIETFFDPERDIILNPLDARCPSWSVFDDCTSRAEFHAAAESLVPHDGGGSEQFWVLAARTLFVETCIKLKEAGRGTNTALADELMNADLSDLHRLVEDTMAGPISTPAAARMAESVRAVFNVNAKAMQMLPQSGNAFSVRQWVNGDGEPGSILFLSARYVDMSVLSQLLTLWLDTAINTLMTGRRTRDLKLWFLIDELGALHRLPSLEKGLQTARNFGGAIVTGVHTFAKLKEVYGENMAMTLSSLARTKLILATADRETATWCSDIIGHREVREMEEGYSYGYNNARDAVSLTPRRQVVPLLLPDEFMGLPSLEGFIKFPDGFPAAPISLRPRDWPRLVEGFIPREDDEGSKAKSKTDAANRDEENSEGTASDGSDEGDPRKMKEAKEQKNDPIKQRKTKPRVRGKRAKNRKGERSKSRSKANLKEAVEAPLESKEAAAQGRPQGELPLQDQKDEKREADSLKEPSRRSDRPDPDAAQREGDERAKTDKALQEEQQRALLGDAAREVYGHDLGDFDAEM